MKDSENVLRKLGLIGIGLCAACCLLPIVAITFGLGALTTLSAYLQWAGILIMGIVVILFVVYFLRKRRAPACDIECGCREGRSNSKNEVQHQR